MPYITPPPVLPTDVGTDFLLDEGLEETEDTSHLDDEMAEEFEKLKNLTERQTCQ